MPIDSGNIGIRNNINIPQVPEIEGVMYKFKDSYWVLVMLEYTQMIYILDIQ